MNHKPGDTRMNGYSNKGSFHHVLLEINLGTLAKFDLECDLVNKIGNCGHYLGMRNTIAWSKSRGGRQVSMLYVITTKPLSDYGVQLAEHGIQPSNLMHASIEPYGDFYEIEPFIP